MKIEQVAAITWTIRDFVQTPEGFRESCRKLADIGFKAIQISARPADMAEADMVQICNEFGLKICATHEPADKILSEPESVVETLKKLGCRYTAYPFPAGIDLKDEDDRKAFLKKLDHAGKVLREAGLVLAYHNHAIEFLKVGGKTVFEEIFEETDPRNVQAEPDTYWIQLGGGNPVEWCQALKGRLPLLHIKDVGVYEGNDSTMTEIGSGNLDFKAILAAAEASGCEWFIVEQDECPGDPFESLRKSFEYIKANLVS